MGLDIGKFYLGTPMAYLKYIRVHASFIPQEVMDQYYFTVKANRCVYFEIRKGMNGLIESGIIAFTQLVQNIAPFGYEPMRFTPVLWSHTTRKITFALCVNNFGVKYFSKNYALQSFNAVKSQYQCTVYWNGSLYYVLNLEWHYDKFFVNMTMKDYVRRALSKFKNVPSKKPQHPPYPWNAPVYGPKTSQEATYPSTAPLLDKSGTHRIQAISDFFLR